MIWIPGDLDKLCKLCLWESELNKLSWFDWFKLGFSGFFWLMFEMSEVWIFCKGIAFLSFGILFNVLVDCLLMLEFTVCCVMLVWEDLLDLRSSEEKLLNLVLNVWGFCGFWYWFSSKEFYWLESERTESSSSEESIKCWINLGW